MRDGICISDLKRGEIIKIAKSIEEEKANSEQNTPFKRINEWNHYFPIYVNYFINISYKTIGTIISNESFDDHDEDVGERIYFIYKDFEKKEIKGQYQIMTHWSNSDRLISIKNNQMKIGSSVIVFYDPINTEKYWVYLIDTVKRPSKR